MHACDGCGIDIETDELRCDICKRYSKPTAPTKRVVKIHELVMPDIPEYSTSMPTGTYAGKRWKRRTTDGWTLGEYIDDGADDGTLLIRWTPIEVIPRKPTVPFPTITPKEVKE